ncbi:lipocalin family protein [Hyphomonadaceae bacterium BL14]|nr:lipocalin family protein [Hyphomonadaceae bacterium BL14]
MMRLVLLAALAALAACAPQPERRSSDAPLTTVTQVDLERYLGRWYEIARYDSRFERGCDGVTADYAMREDGLLSVVNTCYRDGLDGRAEEARGRARIIPGSGNAKLEVSFFGPFWGDYWVIELDQAGYQWAVVSEPRGRYLWVLSRTRHMDDSVLAARLAGLEALGFDTGALVYPVHRDSAGAP